MKFFGYHGVYEEEQLQGQNFFVDVEMHLDLRKPGITDNLEDTINYAAVFNMVKNITENSRFNLIEKLADSIAGEILSTYDQIDEVTVRVRKPEAPINGVLDWAQVEIGRSRMKHRACIALGSNMGDREGYLLNALGHISGMTGTCVIAASNIYETDPVGYTDQDRFLNMVISVETDLTPMGLLNELQQMELALKRTREIHWGPRTIDADILLYDNIKLNDPRLIIPHPRMFERAFVLIPLKDINPYCKAGGKSLASMIEECDDKDGVKLYKKFAV